MEILKQDIKEISTVGELNGSDVKMILTKGGFHVFVGKKRKNSNKAEALAASSHRAIGLHELEKMYGDSFRPRITKSEHDQIGEVENNNKSLSKSLLDRGLELYTIKKNSNLEFVLYKHGLSIGTYETEIKNNNLLIKNCKFNLESYSDLKKEISKSIANAISKKMMELKLDGVIKEGNHEG